MIRLSFAGLTSHLLAGAVVARVNASPRFIPELIAALQDSWSKYATREGIRNLPETPDRPDDASEAG